MFVVVGFRGARRHLLLSCPDYLENQLLIFFF